LSRGTPKTEKKHDFKTVYLTLKLVVLDTTSSTLAKNYTDGDVTVLTKQVDSN